MLLQHQGKGLLQLRTKVCGALQSIYSEETEAINAKDLDNVDKESDMDVDLDAAALQNKQDKTGS